MAVIRKLEQQHRSEIYKWLARMRRNYAGCSQEVQNDIRSEANRRTRDMLSEEDSIFNLDNFINIYRAFIPIVIGEQFGDLLPEFPALPPMVCDRCGRWLIDGKCEYCR